MIDINLYRSRIGNFSHNPKNKRNKFKKCYAQEIYEDQKKENCVFLAVNL